MDYTLFKSYVKTHTFALTTISMHNIPMKIMLTGVLIGILLMPAGVSASRNDTYYGALQQLVSLLTKQIHLLEVQLAEEQSALLFHAPRSSHEAYLTANGHIQSQFYDGSYTALYAVDGTSLIPMRDTRHSMLHQDLWDRFVLLIGEEYANVHMQEFRVYSNRNAEYDAFTERDTRTNNWILGVNVYGLDLSHPHAWQEMDELLLHEIGHIMIDDHTALLDSFESTFWNTLDSAYADAVTHMTPGTARDDVVHDYYHAHMTRFVSEYAATSPLEDSVESFVHFVRDEHHEEIHERDRKVNFFYAYPEFVKIRSRIQGIL